MKKTLTILFTFVFLGAFAQENIEVKVEPRPSSLGIQPAFEVSVPQAESGDAIRLWEKTIVPKKLFQKTPKMVKMKDEWIVTDVVISDITSIPLKVITQVSSFTGHIYIRIFMQTEGGFLGSEGSSLETTDAASRFVRNYAVELYKEAVAKELKHEENKLKALENDLSKLSRQNRSYDSKISEAASEQKELNQEVKETKMIMKEDPNAIVLSPEEEKEAKEALEKQIKSTEKDLKKAQKTESKFEKKANKNERAQREKADEIEAQRQKVSEVKIKLENIR